MEKWSKDSLILQRRSGTSESPYVNISEALTIDGTSRVSLRELPSKYHGVKVLGEGIDWLEVDSTIQNEDEYIVDYELGTVTFHKSQNGKQLSFSFKGTGQSFTPASRIYTKKDGQTIVETLDEIIERTSYQADMVDLILKDGNVVSVNGQTGIVSGLIEEEELDSFKEDVNTTLDSFSDSFSSLEDSVNSKIDGIEGNVATIVSPLEGRIDSQETVLGSLESQVEDLYESGYGKPSKTRESFSGTGNITKNFSQVMDGITVLNYGAETLKLKIGAVTTNIPQGMGYTGYFSDFMSIEIQTQGSYHVTATSKDDISPISDTFSKGAFGVTNTGQSYTIGGALENPQWKVSNGKAYLDNAVGNLESYAVVFYELNNVSVASTIRFINTPGDNRTAYSGLAAKYVNNDNWILLRPDSTNQEKKLILTMKKEGVWTPLVNFPFNFTDGAEYRTELTVTGKLFTVTVGGSVIGTHTLSNENYGAIRTGRGYGIVAKPKDGTHGNLAIKTI